MPSGIRALPSGKRPSKKRQKLVRLLEIAHEIGDENPQALPDLVRLIGRRVQAMFMSELLFRKKDRVQQLDPEYVWFKPNEPITQDGASLSDLMRVEEKPRTLSLARDLILPWPWSRERIRLSLSYIGGKKDWGPWKQDFNRDIRYWLPLGIGWVKGGNHSITSGIVQGEGTITVDEVYDISAVYEHVTCDGDTFSRRHDGSTIAQVENVEFAGIFEIGRLMLEKGVSA